MKKVKILFYLISYIYIISFSIFGIVLNIWTLDFNEKIQSVKWEIQKLKEENKTKELYLSEKKSLKNLEKIAKKKFNMKMDSKIHYNIIPKENLKINNVK